MPASGTAASGTCWNDQGRNAACTGRRRRSKGCAPVAHPVWAGRFPDLSAWALVVRRMQGTGERACRPEQGQALRRLVAALSFRQVGISENGHGMCFQGENFARRAVVTFDWRAAEGQAIRSSGLSAAAPVVCLAPGAWVSGRGRTGCVRLGLVRSACLALDSVSAGPHSTDKF